MVDFPHGSLAMHHLRKLWVGDLTDDLANIRYASVFEDLMVMLECLDIASDLQEGLEELLNAHLEKLDVDPEIHKILEESFATCVTMGFALGLMTELVRYQKSATKGMIAEGNEQRTILASNARRSADAARKWLPHQQEFQRLVSDGMKPDRARSEILGNWTEGEDAPSMKTARKWLRLDGEAD